MHFTVNVKCNMNFRHLLPKTPIESFMPYEDDFASYVKKMRTVVANGRTDLTRANAADIVNANSPFEWRPEQPNGDGVLLTHGLFDSPFMMRDLAHFFLQQGYLVRTLLLPGHGTVPGDCLQAKHHHWINCVKYGIEQTAPVVNNLYLCGFSLGAALSMINHQAANNIKGIIGIAPGLKPAHRYAFVAQIHHMFTWISAKAKWFFINPQLSYVKYFSHNYYTAQQSIKVMNKARKTVLTVPAFFSISSDDETVKFTTLVAYFMEQTQPENRLIVYTNDAFDYEDSRIEYRHSAYPEEKILNFSHVCLPIAPDNPYLGRYGDFVDLAHYRNTEEVPHDNYKLGAITAANLARYPIQRLTYNPDFDEMKTSINTFLESL